LVEKDLNPTQAHNTLSSFMIQLPVFPSIKKKLIKKKKELKMYGKFQGKR